ncbi:MAG: inositol monophosphatase [Methanomassiliicoccales archaeon]|nr:inositol monophosphatase [Methanomassiliicoccales archaeon]
MREILESIAREVRFDISSLPSTFEKGKELGIGADGTPTCGVDRVAEERILRCVDEMKLPFNVLSEEIGYIERGYERTLVIDPIDGTHNAILGIPLYSVSLAIGKSSLNDVEFGLVKNIVTGDTYYAEKGKGAFLNGNRIVVRKFNRRQSTFLVYVGMYSHPDTFHVARKSTKTRSLGCASLEMCMVAEGKVDAYYMNCEVHEKSIRVIDIAASALILREAGGEIVTLSGEPLDMPFDLAARSNFLAYGDHSVKEVIL